MTNGEKMQIAQLRGQGLGYTQIARALGMSVNTVKSYCQRNRVQRTNDVDGMEENSDVCRQCGSALVHTPGRKRKLFCSDVCRLQWWHAHRYAGRNARECRCMACGKAFRTDRVQKYCSHGCYIAMRFGGNYHGSDADERAV